MISSILFGQIPLMIEEFARAGGGGSGGGSGALFIGLAGYVPMHLLGHFLRKHRYGKEGWFIAQIINWIIASVIALIFLVIMVFSGSFFVGFYICLPIAVGALAGTGAGLYNWFAKVRQSSQVRTTLTTAEAKDANWNEAKLVQHAKDVFLKFQQDWSLFNIDSMAQYLTPNYKNHITLMMYALKGAHRVNKVNNPQITTELITSATDSDDNSKDTFTVGFTATANDQLFDDRDGKLLFQDNRPFTEFWRFNRNGSDWLLDGIDQGSADATKIRNDIRQFAMQNGLYYSADWGWLLLPADGYLFSKGKFGVSDINNHVIGVVNTVLTQAYTYEPTLSKQGYNNRDKYLVMQTNVQKSYGRILVKRKSGLIDWPVGGGLTRIKMEWGEFNNIYDVYASDLERVTSFELLNPAFMAVLRDLPFQVSIEVIDNVVYIFTKSGTDISHYAALYDVLLKAQKEMQL
jgi:hypothetical protein